MDVRLCRGVFRDKVRGDDLCLERVDEGAAWLCCHGLWKGGKEECVRSGLAKIIMMEIRLGLLDPVPTCGGLLNPAPFENRPFWTLRGEERVRLPSA